MRTTVIIIFQLILLFTVYGQSNWEFHEETYIKGSISTTIEQGMIFSSGSNNFYKVIESDLQLVLTIMPSATILKKGNNYKLIIEDFDYPVICQKLQIVTSSSIDGEFEGWNGETTIILSNGEIWKQYNYKYEYNYSYNADVWVFSDGNSYFMKVEDLESAVEVTKISNSIMQNISNAVMPTLQTGIIQSKIIEDFEGWEGDTKFILDNGQVWKQESYSYMYHYAYRPSVKIIPSNQGYLMKVEGVDETIFVKQLK